MTWQLKKVGEGWDVPVGEAGVTIRLGRKWANRCQGHIVGVELWECNRAHVGDCPQRKPITRKGVLELAFEQVAMKPDAKELRILLAEVANDLPGEGVPPVEQIYWWTKPERREVVAWARAILAGQSVPDVPAVLSDTDPRNVGDIVEGHEDDCFLRGRAKIVGAWYGELRRMPFLFLQLSDANDPTPRDHEGLRLWLSDLYDMEITEDHEITALIYVRTEGEG